MRHPKIAGVTLFTAAVSVLDWLGRGLNVYSVDWPGLWNFAFRMVVNGIARMSTDAIVIVASALLFAWAVLGDRIRAFFRGGAADASPDQPGWPVPRDA